MYKHFLYTHNENIYLCIKNLENKINIYLQAIKKTCSSCNKIMNCKNSAFTARSVFYKYDQTG